MHRFVINQSPTNPVFIGHDGDWHWGARACDKHSIRKRLDRILALNDKENQCAGTFIYGDVFDLILPKDVRRFSPSSSEEDLLEHDAIINSVVASMTDFLEPYSEIIWGIGLGNHEWSIIKYHSVDPVGLLIDSLNTRLREKENCTHRIVPLGYKGFVQFVVKGNKVTKVYTHLYWHGGGGASPVTKGIIDFNRVRQGYNFHSFATGHKHNHVTDMSDTVQGLDNTGQLYEYTPLYIHIPGSLAAAVVKDHYPSDLPYTDRFVGGAKSRGQTISYFKWIGNHYKSLVHGVQMEV